MFTDPRTWGTLLYMLAMLPLGIVYFTTAIMLISVSLTAIVTPILVWSGVAETSVSVDGWQMLNIGNGVLSTSLEPWALPLLLVGGVLLLFLTLHIARGIGKVHGLLAKHLLVKGSQYS
jgi:hypothetical protein